MQSASLRQFVLVGLLASIGGCYSPYGYQNPYGPAPYQPYGPYTQPGGFPATGQPYVPNGQPGVGSPTPLTPPGGSPSTYDTNGPLKFNDNNNNAPPFKSSPDSGGNKTVPLPGDEPGGAGPAASNSGLQPTSGLRIGEMPSEFDREPASNPPAEINQNEAAPAEGEGDPFEPPVRGTSSRGSSGVIRKVSLEVPAAPRQLNPYGRDKVHANPEWLRGVIDYDRQQRTWQIIYSASPEARDPNGGTLTLGNHPGLGRCRSGDIVLVEGAIDSSQLDARGKPVYALDNVTPLAAE